MRWEIQIKSTKINEYLGMMYELVEGGRGGEGHFCVTSGEKVLCLIRCTLGEMLRDKNILGGWI
jgi:hypothetical protein